MSSNSTTWRALLCISTLSALAACRSGAEVAPPSDVTQGNACGAATLRNLANLAIVLAEDLGRWDALNDLETDPESGMLRLSAGGAARCRDRCPGVEALLRRQAQAPDFARALAEQRRRQAEAALIEGAPLGHELVRLADDRRACGEVHWYDVTRADCSGDCRFDGIGRLSQELMFAGHPGNPCLELTTATELFGREGSLVGVVLDTCSVEGHTEE